jgi:hypothetical protein
MATLRERLNSVCHPTFGNYTQFPGEKILVRRYYSRRNDFRPITLPHQVPVPIDRTLYDNPEHYVLLTDNGIEEILTAAEMQDRLEGLVATTTANLPTNVLAIADTKERATYLLANYCELQETDGSYYQWYACRF